MELELAKRLLEGSTTRNDDEKKNPSTSTSIDGLPDKFFNQFIMLGLKVDVIEPGRILCSMEAPRRLLNSGNFLHGGATASLIDILGATAITSVSEYRKVGVSVEISVSYMDSAFLDEEIEIEAKVLRVGKTIGVASVELRKKKTGKIIAQGRHTMTVRVASVESRKKKTGKVIAQGRHTKYLPITSKLWKFHTI